MVVDTSAIIAILRDEPERRRFNEIIESVDACYFSTASLLETRIVLHSRKRDRVLLTLDGFMSEADIEIVDVSRDIAEIAFDAFRKYGKGQGKGAGLNYGDCFSYALAKEMDLPLLFKGNDFSQTDIRAATELYS
ncbi:MAG: type II toxin-antitoxin system VapC family toxin [Alphaproteobacteria bacterium]|nr:type II toxin-antitoxin system VapC family toxin [Alphaproteobacteria bacterium]MDP6831367.1 type II toxin-antitoxin system VapC family toxin [Alphaproteobacteria bacterium]